MSFLPTILAPLLRLFYSRSDLWAATKLLRRVSFAWWGSSKLKVNWCLTQQGMMVGVVEVIIIRFLYYIRSVGGPKCHNQALSKIYSINKLNKFTSIKFNTAWIVLTASKLYNLNFRFWKFWRHRTFIFAASVLVQASKCYKTLAKCYNEF